MKKTIMVINRRRRSSGTIPVVLGVDVTWISELHLLWRMPLSRRAA